MVFRTSLVSILLTGVGLVFGMISNWFSLSQSGFGMMVLDCFLIGFRSLQCSAVSGLRLVSAGLCSLWQAAELRAGGQSRADHTLDQ